MKKKVTYAIGEILIVIVGITLAYWMNSYGENQKNNEEKEKYIASLIQDIESDQDDLKKNLEAISKKIETSQNLINMLTNNKSIDPRNLYAVVTLTEFTPKDFTYQALVNSGDLKLIDDLELKKAIEKHYSNYKSIQKAYQRQENINKEYVGKYFIEHTDYDLIAQGKSPFKDLNLLKNILQSATGSFYIKIKATEDGVKSCDSILKVLK